MAELLDPTLEELYEDAPCGYLSVLPDGEIVRVNRRLQASLGFPVEGIVGRRLQDLLSAGSRIYHATHWGPLLELQGEIAEVAAEFLRADGSRLPVLVNAVLHRTADGQPAVIRASVFDASDRRRYERELVASRDAERAARRVGMAAAGGITLDDLTARAVREAREILRTADVTISADAPRGDNEDPRILEMPFGPPSAPLGTLRAERETPFSPGDRSFAEAIGLILAGTMRRLEVERTMHQRARHDALTGLTNRFGLEERIERAVGRLRADHTPFALCMLDLQRFKLINDSRGHGEGDRLLARVAERLQAHAPEGTTIARAGGDEFALLGPANVTSDDLVSAIDAALEQPYDIAGMPVVLGAHIGSADSRDALPEDLLGNADIAMHAAKAQGGGTHVRYEPALRERSGKRMRLESELRAAISDGQLRVYYQPIVRTTDAALTGFEALVRWEHPERGMVSPGDFIPVAEDSGLIAELGAFVLDTACQQLASWRRAGHVDASVGVTVNVSARQLADSDFPLRVAAALEASGLAGQPSLLGLEVTETLFMDVTGTSLDVLDELSRLGVRLLLDDFGTGASSLARLKRLPFDTLKIDRAFVTGIGRSGEDDAIVAAIVAMAERLDLTVVAEGVEHEEQRALLARLGCDRVQGFLFSRPVPAAELF